MPIHIMEYGQFKSAATDWQLGQIVDLGTHPVSRIKSYGKHMCPILAGAPISY